MKASQLIGQKIAHATDPTISGEVTDILFNLDLSQAVYLMADVTTPDGTAPLMISPVVLGPQDEDRLVTTGHPEDIAQRMQAARHRSTLAVDPSDLPSTLIGPFGNTISPALMAALFNARSGKGGIAGAEVKGNGVWWSTLQNHAVRAHVADVGRISEIHLDEGMSHVTGVVLTTAEGSTMTTAFSGLDLHYNASGGLSVALRQVAA